MKLLLFAGFSGLQEKNAGECRFNPGILRWIEKA
jgi:hypothetical protein